MFFPLKDNTEKNLFLKGLNLWASGYRAGGAERIDIYVSGKIFIIACDLLKSLLTWSPVGGPTHKQGFQSLSRTAHFCQTPLSSRI